MKTISLNISGMTCASCAKLSENAILKVNGVKSASVNIATNKAKVEFDELKTNLQNIIKAIESAGYGASESGKEDSNIVDSHLKEAKKAKKRFIISAIFTLPIFSMMFWEFMSGIKFLNLDLMMWIYALLTAIVVFVWGAHFHISAFKKLKKLTFNMDSLVSMGTLTAFIYSIWAMLTGQHVYFEAAASIITLINLGKWLEASSKGRASQAMGKLLELSAKKARIIRGEKEIEIDINEVRKGEIIHVKAGEKIPLDGEIIEGGAAIDESMLTGESIPVDKKVGNSVFGATINQNGNIKVKVTAISENSILSQIIKMIEDAQSSKAPIQKLADKISGIFVPVVLSIALLTFIIWYVVTYDVSQSIIPAVAVMVIACPCALGLATPTAIMVGTGVGAKMGILIKNGETLEKSNKIDVVVFDKTGTLTEGKPKVTDVVTFDTNNAQGGMLPCTQNLENSQNCKRLQKIAYSLTKLSHHPLSQAVANYAKEQKSDFTEIIDFEEISGLGIKGKCKTHQTTLLLGNKKLIEENKIEINEVAKMQIEKLSNEAKTPLLIAHGNKLIGIIALADIIKDDAVDTVQSLKKANIDVIMITGDNKKTAEAIAKQLGIENVISEVLPNEKAKKVKEIQQNKKSLKTQNSTLNTLKVAFVGDGINDAPALAQADLGIAIGTGSDIAIETGNIVLMKGSPSKVLTALRLSQRTFKTIKQNLFWAFIYNTIGIPIAALGFLNPIFASFAMSMSSVSVVTNSLRIKKFKGVSDLL